MPTFTKDPTPRTPFGKNEWRRSTKDTLYESYMCYGPSVPDETIDGNAGQKILQPGTIMAKITSGPGAGLFGPYQAAGTDEGQTLAKTGTVSGGTYFIEASGVLDDDTDPIAYNANAAAIQAAIDAVADPDLGIVVTGGPVSTTPVVITFNGPVGANVDLLVVDDTAITGGGTLAITESTAGAAGATDGRETAANIVGINDTFLPWQLAVRDVEISVAYAFTAVQAWCFELNAAGQRIALTNTTRDAMLALPGIRGIFK